MSDYITTRAGLIVPAAAFEEAVTATPELREIATIDRDWTKNFFGQVLRNDDDTLISRGGAKGLKIYDELERDAHAYADLQKRKLAVVARPWEVSPASDAEADAEVAGLVTEVLKRIQFDRICMELLDATLKGFSVGEVMWETYASNEHGNLVAPGDVIARDQRRFVFGMNRDVATREYPLRLLTRSNMIEGEALPFDRKFIVHRFGAKDGSPYGLGLGNRLFWPVFFKRQDIGFWLTFADKFGSPTAVGKYAKGATAEEQKKLLAMLRAIANDVGIIVPEGTVVELLEAARSGSIDTYEKLARYMDEQISKAVLGGTMTTTAQGAGLGSGQAEVQDDVRKEIAKADADLLSDTLNSTLVKWIVEYNRPGAALPKLWRDFEQEDIGEQDTFAQILERLVKMGMKVPTRWARERLSIPAPQDGEEVLMAPAAPSPFGGLGEPGAQFAEGEPAQRSANRASQEALAAAAESIAGDWQKLIGQPVEDLVAFLEETGDLVTFRERLGELLDKEPPKELVEALSRATFSAHLAARLDRQRG